MRISHVTRVHSMSLIAQLAELRKLYKDFCFLYLDDEIKQRIHFMYSEDYCNEDDSSTWQIYINII